MMCRLVFVSVIVSLTAQYMVVAVNSNQTLWLQNIADSLSFLCPGDNVCHNKSDAELDAEYDRYSRQHAAPCCTYCSCKDTCGQRENCCFPTGSISASSGPNREECMNLETGLSFLSIPNVRRFYNVIVNCDPSLDFSRNQVDEQAPWGDLYPVYSKSTKDIYKNKSIALCNGVSDAAEWNTVLSCERDISDMLSSGDFANIFSSMCTAVFTYPESEYSDLRHKECFPNLIEYCFSDFPIPEGVSMSKEEIRSACTGDFVSPFRRPIRSFKNVFCSICVGIPVDSSVCYIGNPLGKEGQRNTGQKFGFMLSGSFISSVNKEPASFRTACRSSFNDQMDLKPDCRRILCPVGQFELPGESCSYVAKTMYIGALYFHIRLTPDIPSDHERLKQISVATMNITVIDEPWSANEWVIAGYYCRYAFTQADACFFDTFILILELREITVESMAFYSSIETALTKKVTWQLGNITMDFRQTFQRDYTFSHTSRNNASLYKVSTDDWLLKRNYINDVDEPSIFADYLTKHYFCSLVELSVGDFVLRNDTLVYKRTNRSFFDGEVIDLNRKPKVCLSDTDFTVVNVSLAVDIHVNFFLLSLVAITIMCAR